MSTKNTVIICIVRAALIAAVPLLFIQDSEFGGADGAAEEVIGMLDPAYEAWASPVLEPPGGETESLLFCLQAALGSGIFCFGMGYFVARKKYSGTNPQQETGA